MAKFEMELPTDVLHDVSFIEAKSQKIFGGMTKAGAEKVRANVIANMPRGMKKAGLARSIKVTKTYRTPSDDGINNKVTIGGYFVNKNGVTVPVPLVANMFEYGTSKNAYPKQPFFRRSFRKSEIQSIMLAKQKELSGGLLDDE